MKTVTTKHGDISLVPPTRELLVALYHLLPFGLMQGNTEEGPLFGLVMKKGPDEADFMKLQPPDCDAETALGRELSNALLIAATVAGRSDLDPQGLVLPITYNRTKPNDRRETGIAILTDAREGDAPGSRARRDADVAVALAATSATSGFALGPLIGPERRARSQLEAIGFSFARVSGQLVCLRRTVSDRDPVWALVRSFGIDQMPHMPAVPFEL